MNPTISGKTSVHASHLLAEERPLGHAIVGTFGVGYRDYIGN
jgi:hypothetical protein